MPLGVVSIILEITVLVGSQITLSWENIFHSAQLHTGLESGSLLNSHGKGQCSRTPVAGQASSLGN